MSDAHRQQGSARLAHGTARSWTAVRLLTRAARRLEAAHSVHTRALASAWSRIALIHCKPSGVVGGYGVPIHRNDMVRSPTVAAASVVRLQLERRGAFVLAAFDLGTWWLKSRVAKAVLSFELRIEFLLLRRLMLTESSCTHYREAQEDAKSSPHLHCSGVRF